MLITQGYFVGLATFLFPPTAEPEANAVGPEEGIENDNITLHGNNSKSYNNKLSYKWTAGDGVYNGPIPNSNETTVTVVAPEVDADSKASFILHVTDDRGHEDDDIHNLIVENLEAPVIKVKDIPSVLDENSRWQMDGSGSYDKKNKSLTHEWSIIEGPENITMLDAKSAKPILVIPNVEENEYVLLRYVVDNTIYSQAQLISLSVRNLPSVSPAVYIPQFEPNYNSLSNTDNLENMVFPISSAPTKNDNVGVQEVEIYPNKSNGQSWSLTDFEDPRVLLFGGEFNQNPDSTWKVGPEDGSSLRALFYVSTTDYVKGENRITEKDHKVFERNGYMFNTSDWRNIEVITYVKLNQVIDDKSTFSIDMRGERHNENNPCAGTSYRTQLSPDGELLLRKEQWHPFFTTGKATNIGNILGEWVGIKVLMRNIDVNGTTAVKMETFYSKENLGDIWIKADEIIDSGQLGEDGERCNGEPSQIITWGGPLIHFLFNGIKDVDIKDWSIREIDPS